eukprot:RCo013878
MCVRVCLLSRRAVASLRRAVPFSSTRPWLRCTAPSYKHACTPSSPPPVFPSFSVSFQFFFFRERERGDKAQTNFHRSAWADAPAAVWDRAGEGVGATPIPLSGFAHISLTPPTDDIPPRTSL